MPKLGDFAVCSKGCLGLITCGRPYPVTYQDGNQGYAWQGIHISKELFGKPWSSRTPIIVGHIEDLLRYLIPPDDFPDTQNTD